MPTTVKHYRQNKWMNWTLMSLIRLINLISKRFTYIEVTHQIWAVYLGRTEPGPNAKINCLFSHRHLFGLFLVFRSYFPCPLSILAIYSVHAGYLFRNWHSLHPNYFEATFYEMPGSFNSYRIECMFKHIHVWMTFSLNITRALRGPGSHYLTADTISTEHYDSWEWFFLWKFLLQSIWPKF